MGVFRYVFQILDSFETISHLGINHKINHLGQMCLHLLFHLVNKVIS